FPPRHSRRRFAFSTPTRPPGGGGGERQKASGGTPRAVAPGRGALGSRRAYPFEEGPPASRRSTRGFFGSGATLQPRGVFPEPPAASVTSRRPRDATPRSVPGSSLQKRPSERGWR